MAPLTGLLTRGRIVSTLGANYRDATLEGDMPFMSKLSMVGDIWAFLRQRKKFWLLPIIIILLALGMALVFAGTSAIAPFIYTIF